MDYADGRAWRAWWFAAGPHHLYLTWNSDLKDTRVHRKRVNELVTSLRLADRAS